MPRPCTYVGSDTTKDKCKQFYGVSEREKQSDDIRPAYGLTTNTNLFVVQLGK